MKTKIYKEYNLKWQIKNATHYQISEDKNIINMKTGRILKRTINCCSIGYWIDKKFIPINKINQHCEKIKYDNIPF